MLVAALVSEHVDEALWLINHDRRVTVTWRRSGGHLLAHQLLHGPAGADVLVPSEIHGYDMGALLTRFTSLLDERGGARLRADVARFGAFARSWPGSTLATLDEAALRYGATA